MTFSVIDDVPEPVFRRFVAVDPFPVELKPGEQYIWNPSQTPSRLDRLVCSDEEKHIRILSVRVVEKGWEVIVRNDGTEPRKPTLAAIVVLDAPKGERA